MIFLDSKTLEKLRLAGEIAQKALKYAESLVKPNVKLLYVCEKIEEMIVKEGGKPAFPLNISVNNIAAHYTSPPNDMRKLPSKGVVKIDLGVHIDGYIVDTARTIILGGNYTKLVKAAKEALDAAIQIIKDGVKVSEIGEVIEKNIVESGFKPIRNLTGHVMERYNLHTGISIPNISAKFNLFSPKLKEDMIVAIEPFVTTGEKGIVLEASEAYIYRLTKLTSPKTKIEEKIVSFIYKRFKTLPFALRWMKNIIKPKKYKLVFQNLVKEKVLYRYPVLKDADNGIVSQMEDTILVKKNGCEVLTRK